jgi:hypothetical protein
MESLSNQYRAKDGVAMLTARLIPGDSIRLGEGARAQWFTVVARPQDHAGIWHIQVELPGGMQMLIKTTQDEWNTNVQERYAVRRRTYIRDI